MKHSRGYETLRDYKTLRGYMKQSAFNPFMHGSPANQVKGTTIYWYQLIMRIDLVINVPNDQISKLSSRLF